MRTTLNRLSANVLVARRLAPCATGTRDDARTAPAAPAPVPAGTERHPPSRATRARDASHREPLGGEPVSLWEIAEHATEAGVEISQRRAAPDGAGPLQRVE